MSVAKKGPAARWPDNKIPFVLETSLTRGMKDEIRAAFEHYHKQTQVRFVERNGENGFVCLMRDDHEAGCGNSTIGFNGGPIIIKLKEDCDMGTVVHELCHALGVHHEMQRPDREDFVHVNEENIDEGKEDNFKLLDKDKVVTSGPYDYDSIMHYHKHAFADPDDAITIESTHRIGQRDHLSDGDVALVRRIVNSNVHVHELDNNGKVGKEIMRYNWSDGWTIARFYNILGTTYGLFLKSSDGTAHVHVMNSDGTVGAKREEHNWNSGWTIVEHFNVGFTDYLFFLKTSDGTVHINEINRDGTVGKRTYTSNWTSGWTHARFYNQLGFIYLFLLKSESGRVDINHVDLGGVIGGVVESYNWTSGWTTVEVLDNRILFLLKEKTGKVDIHEITWDGKVGRKVETRDWSEGWTSAKYFDKWGTDYILLLKEDTGRVDIHKITSEGGIGRQTDSRDWSAGWSSVETISTLR